MKPEHFNWSKTANVNVLATAALCLATVSADAQSLLRNRRLGAAAPAAVAAADAADGESAAFAAAAEEETPEGGETRKSDLNFRNAELDAIFLTYGRLVGRTVLPDPQTPKLTLSFQSRPGQKLTKEEQIEAIEVLLEMNGIHFEEYGENFVRAIPRKDARKEGIPLYLDADDPAISSVSEGRVISVNIAFKNITTEEGQKALEGFKSNSGLLQVFERTNSIVVTDTRQNISKMIQIARMIDIATPVMEIVEVIQIKNASATEVQAALQKIVEDAMKYQEKDGKAQQNAQNSANRMTPFQPQPASTLLRRPGQPNNPQPAAPSSVESLITSVSDADRGMIRGRVLIVPDERSNKLIIVTNKSNMDFFRKVIEAIDIETTPDTQVKVYRLKYADAEDVADMINDLIGNAASSRSGSRSNQNQNARNGQGSNLTRNNGNNAANRAQPATSVNKRTGEPKAGELSKDNTTVLADKRINGLVVMTNKELVPTVESIIESMDVKLSQVLIETCVVEVTLGDDLNTGVDWVMRGRQNVSESRQAVDGFGRKLFWDISEDDNGVVTKYSQTTADTGVPVMETVSRVLRDGFVNNGNFGLGGGGGDGATALNMMMNVATNATSAFFGGANPIGSGLNYMLKSDKLNLAAVINASKTDNHAKYIASPIVMTVDNKESIIETTASRQFLTGWQAVSGYNGAGMPSPNYTAKDIGIKLKLTPKINPNGTVMLKVHEEYSKVSGKQDMLTPVGSQYVNQPIDVAVTRTLESDVLLENGQTVVFGGLTQTETSDYETGIPILKDIPWIGKWLFGKVVKSESRSELLVFLTPYVLDDAESAQAEALRRKNALSDSRPWDDHGWSASALADPVAKKEVMRRLKEEAKKQDEDRQTKLAIEKWKMDRAKALEKMDETERKFWIDAHRDELEKEEKEKFDAEMKEQSDLKVLVEQIKSDRMEKATAKIEENAKALEAENVHGKLEAERAARQEAPAEESGK